MDQTMKLFCDHLNEVHDRIDKFIDNLNKTHNENMKTLIKKYEDCIEKLYGYKTQINQILMAIEKPQANIYFEKISEVRVMGLIELEEEKKLWQLHDPKFTTTEIDFYKFDEFKIFNFWKPAEIQPCEHIRAKIVVTCCKKAHCAECLKKIIQVRGKNCPCNIRLSPKNVHEAMGYSYDIDYLFH